MTSLNKLISLLLTAGYAFSGQSLAGEADDSANFAEFDPIYLNNDRLNSTVDLKAFSYGNPLPPGDYYADVEVNGELKGREKVRFIASDNHKKRAALCITPSLLRRISLLPALYKDKEIADAKDDRCTQTKALFVDKIRWSYSNLDGVLRFTIPQAWLDEKPAGYIDPELWEEGNNALFTGYQVNHYEAEAGQGERYRYNYVGLNSGINVGRWHIRHNGSWSWSTQQAGRYTPFQTWLQTDLIPLRSQLRVGDVFSSGSLFSGGAMRGVQLQTDDRMLPLSKRGYAPVVRGVANSNAMVSIRQNGREIYNRTVPAGPFVIDDLYMMSNSGELVVSVTESDGSVNQFTVPYAAVGQIIRPGNTSYEVDAGYLRSANTVLDEYGLQATWQRGVNNLMTINAGAILGKSYYSGIIGSVFSTPVGTLGGDVTYAKSSFSQREDVTGQSYHLYYSNNIYETGTNFNIGAYRYSTEGFYNWSQVAAENDRKTFNHASRYLRYRPKGQFLLSLNQTLPQNWGSFYANATHRDYWSTTAKEKSISIGYSNNYKKLSYNLTMTNTRYQGDGRWQKQYMLNFSLPLGSGSHVPRLNAQYQRDSRGGYYTNAGISGALGEDNQYSYGLSSSYGNHDRSANWAVNGSAKMQYSTLGASYARNQNMSQWSASASGGVVLHAGGVTLANELNDSFAIIHVPDAGGAKIGSGSGVRLDSRGYAIYPWLSPYQLNMVNIDPTGLPAGLILEATSKEIYPRANSSILVTLPARMGSAVLLQITLKNGQPLPVGSTVSQQNEPVGTVTPGGRLFAQGLAEKGQLDIEWGEGDRRCTIPYTLKGNTTLLNNGIQLLKLTCQSGGVEQR